MPRTLKTLLTLLLPLILIACGDAAPPPSDKPAQAVAPFDPTQPFAVLDCSEVEQDGRRGLALTFSLPLAEGVDLDHFVQVSAGGQAAVDGGWVIEAGGRSAWFAAIEPETTYRVTVSAALAGQGGKRLGSDFVQTLKTRPLEPSLSFVGRGMVLAAGLGKGLPVVSVNVDAADIDFFRIPPEKFGTVLRRFDGHGELWSVEHLTDSGKLAYTGRFDLNPEHNRATPRTLDVEGINALSPPGVYLAVMRVPGDFNHKQVTWFTVTDIGLQVRLYPGGRLDVQAQSLKSGQPLKGVEVDLIDRSGNILMHGVCNAEGALSLDGSPRGAELIVARQGNQTSLVALNQPALDLTEFDIGGRPQLPMELFLYGPRDLYRPGELVRLSGLLRDGDGAPLQPQVLDVAVKRPDGAVAKSFKWEAQELGYYQADWRLPDNAPLGVWQVVVSGAMAKPVVYPLKVEEFMPERMSLTFAPGQTAPIVSAADQTLTIALQGAYLYGAPAAGNRVTGEVQVLHWRSPVESLKGFEFGDIRDNDALQHFELPDLTLDDQGAGAMKIPSRWGQTTSPLEVRVIGSLLESGGRAVVRPYSALIWPRPALLGVRPDFGDSHPEENGTVGFELVKATADGDKLAAQGIDVRLIREQRNYFWVHSGERGWHYEWSDKEIPTVQKRVEIPEGGTARVEMPVAWGHYRLEVRDPAQRLLTSLRFHAGSDWYDDWENAQNGARAAKPDKVTLALDRGGYRPGDTARLKVVPPAAGEALLMVEGDVPLWSARMSLPAEGATVEIPIDPSWNRHDLYVTAMVLRPGRADGGTITPRRSLGLIHLPLDRQGQRLEVAFQTPEKTLPNTPFTARMQVTPVQGGRLPERVMVTLAAVDVGALNLSRFVTPDPFAFFFGSRRYGVEIRDLYHQLIEVSQEDQAKLRFGGDADLFEPVRGGDQPVSDVRIVSLFQGPVAVAPDGSAEVVLDLPDFNGRLRLMALAFGPAQFGSGQTELTVAAPVVAQMAMPRFLAGGDRSTLALDLTNLSGAPQTLKVDLQATAPLALTAQPQTVTLADGAKTTLRFAVEALQVAGSGTINLAVTGEGLEQPIARQWRLGVRPPYPARFERIRAVVAPGEDFTLDPEQTKGLLPKTLRGVLTLSSTVDLDLADRLESLIDYPYGCLEQVSSRAYPLILAAPEDLARFDIKALDPQKRAEMLQAAVDKIVAMQKPSGGFGLWDRESDEEYWLTPYATGALLGARDLGMAVPPTALDRALNRLGEYLNRTSPFFDEHWTREPEHDRLAYRSYAAYVLAGVNRATLGALRRIYDRTAGDAKSGLPLVHLGLALIAMGDRTRGEAALDRALALERGDRYMADYGSKLRDAAQMTALLLGNPETAARGLDLAARIEPLLRERRWLSTQELSALFQAGIALQRRGAPPWAATVTVGGQSQKTQGDVPQRLGWRGEALQAGLVATNRGEEPLYLNLAISGHPDTPPPVLEQGVSVTRRWYTLDGQETTPERVEVGTLLLTLLELKAERRVPDALVVDLLPAGFELENLALTPSIDLDAIEIEGRPLRHWLGGERLRHQELRDDRFVAALDLHESRLVYLVRAVTPGLYHLPPTQVEDMYRPEIRAVGASMKPIEVVDRGG
ncbi:MAG: hypothetical protein AUJ55_06530 [Proteobacteria bacterium CG1_02_64_396]|nr:MAG: hypothetical protein AUJ55_06530 [Proteobacteria bacterium CG1_02_64_396]